MPSAGFPCYLEPNESLTDFLQQEFSDKNNKTPPQTNCDVEL